MYIRNGANTSWIKVADIDQTNSLFNPSNAVPVGAVNTFAMSTAPTGWLPCDGALISRTTYSNLFTVVGVVYGAGDGSTTFKMPDLRGEFVRGFDASRGVDTGRAFGSTQADTLKSHDHTMHGQGPVSTYGYMARTTSNSWSAGGGAAALGLQASPDTGMKTSADGGTETRPRNLALLYCIKY